ncbi:MAG: GNAT family N-acetyltransferase [Bacillota bacterium]|nr:GNAT family N-acetyltransferase [Bacillota bacterium]
MNVKFERAAIEDVEELINVRNQSFYSDYVKYGECPAYNLSIESMTNTILNRIVYKIICDHRIIGNISIRDNQDNTYYLSCLCVIPDYENKGIGQAAMKFIGSEFPYAVSWTLITPADKERNQYFYKKAGFNIVDEQMDGSVKVVVFEKKMKPMLDFYA